MKMIHQAITLNGLTGELIGYIPDNSPELFPHKVRPTFVICPGGGYQMVSDREGEPLALKLIANDYNAFVLKYSTEKGTPYPTALLQLAESIRYIRRHAESLHVDTNKIILCGFSAGGHLASQLAACWSTFLPQTFDFIPEEIMPHGLMLAYPVITTEKEYSHSASFQNLLGDKVEDDAILNSVSIEKLVNQKMPPTFIWHTEEDPVVPVENSLLLFQALRKNQIPCELHIFPKGGHGLSLGTEMTNSKNPQVAQWLALFLEWVTEVFKN